MAGLPVIGPACSTTPKSPGGISSLTAASRRLATDCRAGWGRALPRRTGPSSQFLAMAGSILFSAGWKPRGAPGSGITVIVVNNAASGYVKALQHAMMGGRYQSADLVEMNYAAIARAMGCGGIRVEDPETLSGALRRGMEERDRPTVIDV